MLEVADVIFCQNSHPWFTTGSWQWGSGTPLLCWYAYLSDADLLHIKFCFLSNHASFNCFHSRCSMLECIHFGYMGILSANILFGYLTLFFPPGCIQTSLRKCSIWKILSLKLILFPSLYLAHLTHAT